MSIAFLNSLANYAVSQITHIGLLNPSGVELASFYYARAPVVWASAIGGIVRPTANLDFIIVPGDEVRYWAGFSAATGGTPSPQVAVPLFVPTSLYIYRLQPASTGIGCTIAGG